MASVRLQLLGPPVVFSHYGVIELNRRKSLALIAYLAVERRAHSRDELATLLWPDSGQSVARKSLRQCLYSLREAIGRESLVYGQDTVEFAPDSLVVDVEEFRRLVAGCAAHARAEVCDNCVADVERATQVYRDDLLTGFSVADSSIYDEWQLSATEDLRNELASALNLLVTFYEQRGAWEPSIAFARRLLSLDPLEESAHRTVMRLLALSGHRVGALRHFRECMHVLEEELESEPEPETLELYEQIRTRRYPDVRTRSHGSFSYAVVDRRKVRTAHDSVCFVRVNDHPQEVRSLIEATTGRPAGSWWGSIYGRCSSVGDAVELAAKLADFALSHGSNESGTRMRLSAAVDVATRDELSPDGSDYYHQFALLATALDGETLLSDAIAKRLDGNIPNGYRVESIGAHRLADLGPPVELHRLRHRDAGAEHPVLRALHSGSTGFPIPATALVGRRREVGEVLAFLTRSEVRIVTIVGPAGIGKSRVSMHVAAAMGRRFRDGVIVVDLSLARAPEELPGRIVAALSLRDSARQRRSPYEISREHLKNRQCLLLLDNFEQLSGGGDFLSHLLSDCLEVKALVTSRAPIAVGAEHEYLLSPLDLPEDGLDVARTLSTPAVQLFLDCAQKHLHLTRDDRTVSFVAAICRRLDGIPLAIELAAPQLKFMNAEELLGRLQDRIGWLENRDGNVAERQRTIESAIQWSYDLLDDDRKRMFAMLSVFRGSWNLKATESIFAPFFEQVASLGPSVDSHRNAGPYVLRILESIAEQNLVVRTKTESETRYQMLQSISEYASDRFSVMPDANRVREQHAHYYRALAQECAKELHGPSMIESLEVMELDHTNFEHAIEWYQESGETKDVIAFAVSLVWFWYLHGHFVDGRRHLELALSRVDSSHTSFAVGRGYRALGWMTFVEGDLAKASEILRHAVAVARATDDAYGESEALSSLGITERFRGNSSEALELFDEALRLAREAGDELLVMYALNWSYASSGGKFTGEPPFAELNEALRLSQKTGDLWSCAHIQNGLGDLYRETGNASAALAAYEDSLAQMEVLNDRWMMAWNYEGLAATACREGRPKAGARDYHRALELFAQLGDKGDALYILEQVVRVLVELGRLAEIPAILAGLLALHGQVDAHTLDSRDERGESIESGDGGWAVPDDLKAAVRHCRETYPAEWSSGRTTSLERIVSMLKIVVSPSRGAGHDE